MKSIYRNYWENTGWRVGGRQTSKLPAAGHVQSRLEVRPQWGPQRPGGGPMLPKSPERRRTSAVLGPPALASVAGEEETCWPGLGAQGAAPPGETCALRQCHCARSQTRPGAQSGGTMQAPPPTPTPLWIPAPRRIRPRSACCPTLRPGLGPARSKGNTLPTKVLGGPAAPIQEGGEHAGWQPGQQPPRPTP